MVVIVANVTKTSPAQYHRLNDGFSPSLIPTIVSFPRSQYYATPLRGTFGCRCVSSRARNHRRTGLRVPDYKAGRLSNGSDELFAENEIRISSLSTGEGRSLSVRITITA